MRQIPIGYKDGMVVYVSEDLLSRKKGMTDRIKYELRLETMRFPVKTSLSSNSEWHTVFVEANSHEEAVEKYFNHLANRKG